MIFGTLTFSELPLSTLGEASLTPLIIRDTSGAKPLIWTVVYKCNRWTVVDKCDTWTV